MPLILQSRHRANMKMRSIQSSKIIYAAYWKLILQMCLVHTECATQIYIAIYPHDTSEKHRHRYGTAGLIHTPACDVPAFIYWYRRFQWEDNAERCICIRMRRAVARSIPVNAKLKVRANVVLSVTSRQPYLCAADGNIATISTITDGCSQEDGIR